MIGRMHLTVSLLLAGALLIDKSAAEDAGSARSSGPHLVVTSVRPPEQKTGDASPYGPTRKDYAAIINALPVLRDAVPVREVHRRAQFGENMVDVRLIGTVAGYSRLHERRIARGRFLVDEDVERLLSVAVIGDHVARKLFVGRDPLGQKVGIEDNHFIVVGTTEARPGRGRNGAGDDPTDEALDDPGLHIYIPLSTMRARLGDREIVRTAGTQTIEHFELSRIEILLEKYEDVPTSTAVVQKLLDRLHEGDGFKSYSVRTCLEQQTQRQK